MTFPPNSTALYKEQPVTVSCYTPDGVQIEKGNDLLTVLESELMPLAMPTPLPELAAPERQPVAVLIANNAGGVGKTSLAVALAHVLASWSLRVALLDLDPQSNATTFSGVLRPIEDAETVHALLTPDAALPPLVPAHGYDLLPASAVLRQTAKAIVKADAYDLLLPHLPALQERYDLILMDCGPSLDALATAGGMIADFVMTPTSTNVKGTDGFFGAADFVAELAQLSGRDIRTCLFVPTMHQKRTRVQRQAYEEMLSHMKERGLEHLIATPIFRNQKWEDAAAAGKPVTLLAPGTPASLQAELLAREFTRSIGWDV